MEKNNLNWASGFGLVPKVEMEKEGPFLNKYKPFTVFLASFLPFITSFIYHFGFEDGSYFNGGKKYPNFQTQFYIINHPLPLSLILN